MKDLSDKDQLKQQQEPGFEIRNLLQVIEKMTEEN